ncbi:helix-turn-helix domain-containing protein [Avibacterium paragallinarum]|uniref:Bacteriophage CI repressor N-terminal domain-containing protein n=1 Tax=Avibacterium paragallinarum TaxID=728 RepID=A0A377IBI1_AVIPA|nr:helix-turn-helix domain-containing protein [Avibacterium paragallinarum]POY46168.1 hypothetical protein C3364_08895 [Avibacterium paragallinarum]RZN75748.1 hypothetical protein EC523_07210 [Avibacterium paragallinarum]RZN76560.1 hypothetical protein EC523_04620 [Avibacterium paragallinarum]STO71906.1 Uncharacterised protein [Avibacterium paragallinarum]STO72626.1 Uncharacterised protein [Avibacterium paragallinarum]
MKNFTDIANRLKTELSLTMDKEVAELLKMSKSAFAERKRRGVFPENALRLLELERPDLKVDINYILSGVRETNNANNEELVNAIKDKATEIDMDDYSKTISPSLITPSDAINPVLLNMDEIKLLANFRRSDTQGRQLISETAKMCCKHSIANMRLAEYTEKELLDYTKRNPEKNT